jgi:hypothetical protein
MSRVYQNLANEYYVGHIRISPDTVLAPMVGVTDSVFRRTILSLGGCGLVSERYDQCGQRPAHLPLAPQQAGVYA